MHVNRVDGYRAAVPAKALLFSLCLDTGRPWQDVRSIGSSADSAGWHCLYVPDHFMPHDARGRPRPGPVLEAWSCLTALAMLTRQVRVGTLVLGSTYRHPAVVANMAATVDQLSAGRLTLGVGAGWQTNEHRAYGISLPDVHERLDRFEEAGAVVRALTRGAPTTYHGAYYAVQDAFCEPPPVQPALPILIGGGGERRTLAIAARSPMLGIPGRAARCFAASRTYLIDTVRRQVERRTMFGGSAGPRSGSSRQPVKPRPARTTERPSWEPRKASRRQSTSTGRRELRSSSSVTTPEYRRPRRMTSSSSFKRRLFDSSASGATLLGLDYGMQVTAVTSTRAG